jgi:hypothetical protein
LALASCAGESLRLPPHRLLLLLGLLIEMQQQKLQQ